MRDNWLGTRVFAASAGIVAPCCRAWNNLMVGPWTVTSLRLRRRLSVMIGVGQYKTAHVPPDA